MKRPIIDIRFYETYHFAFAIKNILEDQFEYIRSLNDFYGDGSYLRFSEPYQPYSAFHQFLEFVLDELLVDNTEKFDLERWRNLAERFKDIPSVGDEFKVPTLPIEDALRHHGFEFESFVDWLKSQEVTVAEADEDHIYDYLNELRLCGPYEELLYQSVKEAFFLLFGNRHVLLLFNEMIARQICDTQMDDLTDEHAGYFAQSGVLKRAYMPEWVRRAVFYRDRGMCVSCKTDLSGVLNIWGESHFDHIVPLAAGGLNDVANIQLLCAPCNLKKGDGSIFTTNVYEDWYPLPTEKPDIGL
jgi:hypothetical protein